MLSLKFPVAPESCVLFIFIFFALHVEKNADLNEHVFVFVAEHCGAVNHF